MHRYVDAWIHRYIYRSTVVIRRLHKGYCSFIRFIGWGGIGIVRNTYFKKSKPDPQRQDFELESLQVVQTRDYKQGMHAVVLGFSIILFRALFISVVGCLWLFGLRSRDFWTWACLLSVCFQGIEHYGEKSQTRCLWVLFRGGELSINEPIKQRLKHYLSKHNVVLDFVELRFYVLRRGLLLGPARFYSIYNNSTTVTSTIFVGPFFSEQV